MKDFKKSKACLLAFTSTMSVLALSACGDQKSARECALIEQDFKKADRNLADAKRQSSKTCKEVQATYGGSCEDLNAFINSSLKVWQRERERLKPEHLACIRKEMGLE